MNRGTGTAPRSRLRSCILACVLYPLFLSIAFAGTGDLVDIGKFIPGVRLDIRYYTADNFIGTPITGYEKPRCLLTRQAALALQQVQAELEEKGHALKIFDCYRPQRAVDHFVRWARDPEDTRMKSTYYPGVDKRHLFRDGYIAEKSGHSRGSTVDLSIVSLQGGVVKELDMGTGWDFFGLRSWMDSAGISELQKQNRLMLKTLMEKHGFVPIREEWWHYTLANEPFPDTYFDFAIE